MIDKAQTKPVKTKREREEEKRKKTKVYTSRSYETKPVTNRQSVTKG